MQNLRDIPSPALRQPAGFDAAHPPRENFLRRYPIVSAIVGNALESYDFIVYVYLATFMSRLFFPRQSEALVLTFGAFAVGYVARPVGSIIIGHFGDRLGRKTTLLITMSLMAISTVAIGFLPTYAAVGIAAPILLTLLRLLQGLSFGGEYGGSAAYMIEHAHPDRRGFATSFQQFSSLVGTLAGSGLCALLTVSLGDETMLAYGWRIPYFIGIVLGVVSIYIRFHAPETPAFEELKKTGQIVAAPLRRMWVYWRDMLRIIGLVAPWGVTFTFYLYYAPTYLSRELHHSTSFSLLVSTSALLLVAILTPLVGLLSDRVGRKPLLLLACILPIVITYPLFLLLPNASLTLTYATMLVLAMPVCFFSGAGPATLCELMPTNVRIAGLSVPYAFAAAFFSGFTPLIMTAIVRYSGNPISVTWYVVGASVVGLITVLTTTESSGKALR